jgi:long-chain acyl-CoA synthetase
MTEGLLLDESLWPNGSGSELSACANMAQPFLHRVDMDPDRVATVSAGRSLTYRQLNRIVNRIANALLAAGVTVGDRVAYLLPNAPELVQVYLAVQKIGAVCVPLNMRAIAADIAYCVRASGASTAIFAPRMADRVHEALLACGGMIRRLYCFGGRASWCRSLDDEIAAAADTEPALFSDPQALSRIQFTGGTTGPAKGVERTHRADLFGVEGTYLSNGLLDDEAKVVLIQCPLEHHGGHSWFCMGLACGATLVLEDGFHPADILRDIERFRVSYMILLPPTTYTRLICDPAMASADVSSVRLIQSSAGGMTKEIAKRIYDCFPNGVINFGWGQTESGLGSSLHVTREMVDSDDPRVASVGKPMPFTELRIVDAEGKSLPDGEIGECAVRSPAVMRGYHDQTDLTKQAFTDDGWLLTGDLMTRDTQGYYYLKSRKRQMIKSGGENVYAEEVANVVKSHPSVRDCAVYGVADATFGEVVATVVELVAGTCLSLDEIQRFCATRLSSYKKPRRLVIVDSLDRDYSGKLDRSQLAALCAAPVSEPQPSSDSSSALTQVSASPEIWRISVPLTSALETDTACYAVRCGAQWLLVDVGECSSQALQTLESALHRLGATTNQLDVVITHEHPDHVGLLAEIRDRVNHVYASDRCARALTPKVSCAVATSLLDRLTQEGFDLAEVAALARVLASQRDYSNASGLTAVADRQRISVGSEKFDILLTPGHAEGHACVYHQRSRTLFSGDHILFHVAPPLMYVGDGSPVLANYLLGLERIERLDVDLTLPGHGAVVGDPQRRIAELQSHHIDRVREVAGCVRHGAHSASELVHVMNWAVPWQSASISLKWLMCNEAVVYLDHCVTAGLLRRRQGRDGAITYEATN